MAPHWNRAPALRHEGYYHSGMVAERGAECQGLTARASESSLAPDAAGIPVPSDSDLELEDTGTKGIRNIV
eukprot:7051228-Alexandrium_andersonii.AAC.1